MPFDPSSLGDLVVDLRGVDLGSGGSNISSWSNRVTNGPDGTSSGSFGTVAASSTPAGGKSADFSGQNMTLTNIIFASVSASSSPAGAPFVASAAVDGDSSGTRWLGTSPKSVSPQWLQLDLTAPRALQWYKIWAHPTSNAYSPTAFKFQGYNGSTWVDLDTRTGVTWGTAGTPLSFSFSNSTAYSSYRLYITDVVSATDFCCVSEIQVSSSTSGVEGELWVVVKADSNTGSGTAWWFGSSTQFTAYPYTTGNIIENFGVTTHSDQFTPSMSLTSWRLYRVKLTTAGTMTCYLDENLERTKTGLSAMWKAAPYISNGFQGNIAGLLVVNRLLTSGEAADLITWHNNEYGLSVPGGSTPSYDGAVPNPATISSAPIPVAAATNPAAIGSAAAYAGQAGVTNPAIVGSEPIPEASVGNPATITSITGADTSVAGVVNPAAIASTPVGSAAVVNPAVAGSSAIPVAAVGNPAQIGANGSGSLDEAESYAEAGADADDPITVELDLAETYAEAGADAAAPVAFDFADLDAYAHSWADAVDTLEVTVDPVTGRPQYSLKVVEMDGDVITELTDATLGIATQALNGRGGHSFALGADDEQQANVPQFSEVQLWRGGQMVPGAWWVVADPEVPIDADTYGFDCLGLSYWFERRLIGKERPELLKNGGFEEGARYWNFGFEAGSNAETPPRWEITDEACEGGKALRIFAEDKVVEVKQALETAAVFYGNQPYVDAPLSSGFMPGGEQLIRDLLAQVNPPQDATITVEGHTADADGGTGYDLSVRRAQAAKEVILAERPDLTVNTVGKGETEPVDPRHTEAAYKKNRRIVIRGTFTQTKIGHRQFTWQSFTYTHPTSAREPLEIDVQVQGRIDEFEGPSKDGWMLYADIRPVSSPATVLNNDYVDIDETSARQVWMGLHASPKVPADSNTYKVTVRGYPTAGATSFDQFSAMPNLKLAFWQTDPRNIIAGLVAHAQDPDYFKSDLNIQTVGPLSGFLLDRPYPWKDHIKVSDAINEIVRADNGPDANMLVTARTRKLAVSPKQGRKTALTFATDGHVGDATIVAFAAPLDGDDVTSTAFVQSSWSGGGMTEVVERLVRPDGIVLESLFQTEQDAPTSTVREQARTAVRFGRSDVVTRVVMSNADTTLLLQEVTIGDTVWLEAHNTRVNASGEYRIVQIDLDPDNDQLAYDVAPEVVV